ncbi:MAG TPA: prepilin peptidase [Bacillota bacterium]|nr:prepilin peptidase [Bacillota bacterium]HPE38892.1 prepilin peptidase [Bacillota bacterium]
MPTILFVYIMVFATLFGLVIGSFLNVCIYRIPEKRTIVKGHSMCMTCSHELHAIDLVPLFSWLFLKGKCRYCGAPIASRYAKIEGLTGLVFATIAFVCQDMFFLPGDGVGAIPKMVSVLALFLMATVIIVNMMIQKDHGSSMYRLSIALGITIVIQIGMLAFTKNALIDGLYRAAMGAAVAVLVLLFDLVIPYKTGSWRSWGKDLVNLRRFRDYFITSFRPLHTSDVFFIILCSGIGFFPALPCALAYGIARWMTKTEKDGKYLHCIAAAGAFVGFVVFSFVG